jgi:hypothetical protein
MYVPVQEYLYLYPLVKTHVTVLPINCTLHQPSCSVCLGTTKKGLPIFITWTV